MIKHRLILSSMALYWALSGCSLPANRSAAAVNQAPAAADETPAATTRATPEPIQLPAKAFPIETLYSLLTAEIAGTRALYDVALSNYVQQARATRDPQVAERATMIARFLGQHQTALDMATLWASEAPSNTDALANASLAHLQLGQLRDAFYYSQQLAAKGGEPLFQNIAASANTLDDNTRALLLADFRAQLAQSPQDEQLLVGIGLLLQQSGHYDQAMEQTQLTLKLHPRSIPAAILEANLLHLLKRDQEAISKMAKLLEFYPENASLRQQYARILTRYDLALAQQQFSILHQQLPNNGDILLSLGIIALERRDLDSAKQAFETLLDQDQHVPTAHYYLGRMAEQRSDLQEAIMHYLQVNSGNDLLSATLQLLDIFVRQEDFLSAEEHMGRVHERFPEQSEALYVLHGQALLKHQHLAQAEQILSQGLIQFPQSIRLLFARAMLNHEREYLSASERDLRRILSIDQNNVAALNSLGYILADRTQRFQEAQLLLEKALQLKPDDAAIMDSMGWLLYRTGKYPEALHYLRQAYEAAPNAEIGAHLGEVLWALGQHTEARRIWQQAQQRDPNNRPLVDTLKRFKVEL